MEESKAPSGMPDEGRPMPEGSPEMRRLHMLLTGGRMERISRPLAMDMYRHGIPVTACSVDRKTKEPAAGPFVPDPGYAAGMALPLPEGMFLDWTAGLDWAEQGRKAEFYIPTEQGTLHFEFADGSNPYVYYAVPRKRLAAVKRWLKSYIIRPAAPTASTPADMLSCRLWPRDPGPEPLFPPGGGGGTDGGD